MGRTTTSAAAHRLSNSTDDAPARRDLRLSASSSGSGVSSDLLTPAQAAQRLGIQTTTFYDWLGRARIGRLVLHGKPFALRFRQTGTRGQGRILIETAEIERLSECLLVRPRQVLSRAPRSPARTFPGIHVPLGRPGGGGESPRHA